MEVKGFTSCAGCSYRRDDKCYWFNHGKVIPKEVMNVGCKHREPRYPHYKPTGIVAHIIKIFKGELI
tara:strand:- start:14142 stop:14342 length:201 start_codon:yes stop_codon:yes gene_type:complete